MRILLWALRAFLFFFLFAFALNNQHEAVLKGFFGTEWRTPMVVVVLVSFAAGAVLALAVLAPRLWRPAPSARRPAAAEPVPPPSPRASGGQPDDIALATIDHPPRDGV